jgi:hypothetical protein
VAAAAGDLAGGDQWVELASRLKTCAHTATGVHGQGRRTKAGLSRMLSRSRAETCGYAVSAPSSKPVRSGNPRLGRFDSCAAPYQLQVLHLSGISYRRGWRGTFARGRGLEGGRSRSEAARRGRSIGEGRGRGQRAGRRELDVALGTDRLCGCSRDRLENPFRGRPTPPERSSRSSAARTVPSRTARLTLEAVATGCHDPSSAA